MTNKDFREYLFEYPYSCIYEGMDRDELDRINSLLKSLMELWASAYDNLSRFVHGTSAQYLDLHKYLEDVKTDNEILGLLKPYVVHLSSITNTLLLIFFFDEYRSFTVDEKSMIRLSIETGLEYKTHLLEIFGEI